MRRHKSLQPLSRQHHHGLLLGWKIRAGLAKGVEPERIKRYVDWFYPNHIQPHFEVEEKHIFPVLGNDSELVQKALADHVFLKKLFEEKKEVRKTLERLEKELEAHIRFEERALFQKIQEIATEEQLKLIDEVHEEEGFVENTQDEFWK
ncbi:MAG: hemerythrin domain-containing protein [Candidatus Cyclobacteriaceae bacterium M2_1C_046]